jgi:5-methylcytosine-specific restriction endonuclease McrA
MSYSDPERKKQYDLRYYAIHKRKIKARSKLYYKNNKKKCILRVTIWQKKNSDKHKAYTSKYQKNNRDKYTIYYNVRKTLESKAGGSYTVIQWKSLCKKYSNKCLCCGKRRKLTADHVIPVSKGGTSNIENIQPLCQPCNSSKGNKSTDYRR